MFCQLSSYIKKHLLIDIRQNFLPRIHGFLLTCNVINSCFLGWIFRFSEIMIAPGFLRREVGVPLKPFGLSFQGLHSFFLLPSILDFQFKRQSLFSHPKSFLRFVIIGLQKIWIAAINYCWENLGSFCFKVRAAKI